MLLSSGIPLKEIQEWLGHSDFFITANLYAHLDYESKKKAAMALQAIGGGDPEDKVGEIIPMLRGKWHGVRRKKSGDAMV